jgi:hypothetical protein
MATADLSVEDSVSPSPEYSNGDLSNLDGAVGSDTMAEQAPSPDGENRTDRSESNASAPAEANGKAVNGANGVSKPNPKDPLRPRRKKARRACFACQRAHLTCGMFWTTHGRAFLS